MANEWNKWMTNGVRTRLSETSRGWRQSHTENGNFCLDPS